MTDGDVLGVLTMVLCLGGSMFFSGSETALFPDAVTERGRKHLGELADAVRAGRHDEHGLALAVLRRGEREDERVGDLADLDAECRRRERSCGDGVVEPYDLRAEAMAGERFGDTVDSGVRGIGHAPIL